jgi:choline-glycine betaine transporter
MGEKQKAVIAKAPNKRNKRTFTFTTIFFAAAGGFGLLLFCVFNLFFFAIGDKTNEKTGTRITQI